MRSSHVAHAKPAIGSLLIFIAPLFLLLAHPILLLIRVFVFLRFASVARFVDRAEEVSASQTAIECAMFVY